MMSDPMDTAFFPRDVDAVVSAHNLIRPGRPPTQVASGRIARWRTIPQRHDVGRLKLNWHWVAVHAYAISASSSEYGRALWENFVMKRVRQSRH